MIVPQMTIPKLRRSVGERRGSERCGSSVSSLRTRKAPGEDMEAEKGVSRSRLRVPRSRHGTPTMQTRISRWNGEAILTTGTLRRYRFLARRLRIYIYKVYRVGVDQEYI